MHEAIGEKMCIMAGPFCAYAINLTLHADDDNSKNPRSDKLLEIAGVYFAIEEVVDMLGFIMMASYGIHALRVRPQVRPRNTLVLGLLIACT